MKSKNKHLINEVLDKVDFNLIYYFVKNFGFGSDVLFNLDDITPMSIRKFSESFLEYVIEGGFTYEVKRGRFRGSYSFGILSFAFVLVESSVENVGR